MTLYIRIDEIGILAKIEKICCSDIFDMLHSIFLSMHMRSAQLLTAHAKAPLIYCSCSSEKQSLLK